MELDTIIFFGAGSYLAKQIIKKIPFKNKICISNSLKAYKNKKIRTFKDYINNKNLINKSIKNRKVTVVFFNNFNVDNLIFNKSKIELENELKSNILNNFENAKEISRQLLANGFGRLIFISSSRGLQSEEGISGYSISKNGMQGLMKSISRELARFNITSNTISLGFFKSPLFNKIKKLTKQKLLGNSDTKDFGDIKSIIEAIIFITKSKYVTGTTIFVDGGFNKQ